MKKKFNTIDQFESALGNTGIVEIPNGELNGRIFAKCEWENPTGSIKDRVAYNMVKTLIDHHGINKDTKIMEYSGGSLGISLALICKLFKVKCMLVLPEFTDNSIVNQIKNMGADTHMVDKRKGFLGTIEEAVAIAKADASWSFLWQHENRANVNCHYQTTGVEILNQVPGKIDAWVTSIGTGGTLIGVYRRLVEHYPGLELYATNPAELAYGDSQAPNSAKKFAGSGGLGFGKKQTFVQEFDDKVKQHFRITYEDCLRCIWSYYNSYGIKLGSSAAANLIAAKKIAALKGRDHITATIFASQASTEEWHEVEKLVGAESQKTTAGLAAPANTALEMSGSDFADMITTISQYLQQFLDNIEQQPTSANCAMLSSDLTINEAGQDADTLLKQLFAEVIPNGYNPTSPGFFGFFPGGGLPQSAAADLIAGVVNKFTGRWETAPSAVELERTVTQWLTNMFGYSDSALGILTSGGSQSNLIATYTARENVLKDAEISNARVYVSEQVHFSIRIAAKICGLKPHCLREVPCDAEGRMCTDTLLTLIQQDKDAGYTPFLIVATAGTFPAGLVDDIQTIASIAEQHALWLHLDACYGGFFMMTQAGKALFSGIERCDSIALDPHKSLFLPYGTGALLVKDNTQLKAANSVDADFYGPLVTQPGLDICSYTFEQSRDWRGLRLWLPLKLSGVRAFRDNLAEKLQLTQLAYEALIATPGIQVLYRPSLSVIAFRLEPNDADEQAITQINQVLLDKINAVGSSFLMKTHIADKYFLRLCILSFRTHSEHVTRAIEQIQAISQTLLKDYLQRETNTLNTTK